MLRLPDLIIGISNAWIFIVLMYAAAFVPLSIDNKKVEKRIEREPKVNEWKSAIRIANAITHLIIMPFTLIFSLFLPIKVGTWWFYTGLLIYYLGFEMVLLSTITFATAPLGQPLSKGIYEISRHPGYVGFFLGYIGLGIACTSWILLFCAFVWIVSWHFGVAEEEYVLLEKYGDAYQQYMDRTPRWIGLPKRSGR